MCGRFTLRTPTREIVEAFELAAVADLPLRYNIALSQQVATVRLDASGTRQLSMLKWGLVPSWADDPKVGYSMINARAETVATKPTFFNAFKKSRCLVLADGFFEWQKPGAKIKQSFYSRLKSNRPFAFAGLAEHWRRGEQTIDSCTIVTTEPNELTAKVHDRIPVILPPKDYALWERRTRRRGPQWRRARFNTRECG